MFNDVLKEATGLFDRRFLLNAFFPCLIFWGLLGVVIVTGLGQEPLKLLQFWNQQDAILKVLQTIGFISLVTLSAGFLLSQLSAILKFFEGYWSFPLARKLANLGKQWHQIQVQQLDPEQREEQISQALQSLEQERQELDQQRATITAQEGSASSLTIQQQLHLLQIQESKLERKNTALRQQAINRQASEAETINFLYEFYPSSDNYDQMMPTQLGNILKAAELYPYDRYQLDAVLIWSRLYHLFPDRFILVITEARTSLDFNLSVATLSSLFSLISGIWLLVVKAPGWLFLLCFWGGALTAWLAYQSAIGNAVAYAEQIKVAFDLYRFELVKHLRLKPAKTPDEERQQWSEICEVFYEGQVPQTWEYTAPNAEEAS